jgi:hypothetical protein
MHKANGLLSQTLREVTSVLFVKSVGLSSRKFSGVSLYPHVILKTVTCIIGIRQKGFKIKLAREILALKANRVTML